MINPFQILQMLKNSNNPMTVLQQLSNNNPQIQQLMQNIQNKTPQELEQYARNLAQSKGINLNQLLSQYGLNIN